MFYDQTAIDVFRELHTSPKGLTSKEAKHRLSAYGLNELIEKKAKSRLRIFLEQFNSFIVYILIAATVASVIIGWYNIRQHGGGIGEFADSIAIAVILILNAVFGFIQEYRAQNAIAALKRLASPKAVVMRNAEMQTIDAKELVPGDILVAETGDKIGADSRLIGLENLETQEASLTGESLPVKKTTKELKGKLALGDQKNMLFSGTIVTKGRARAVVVNTGMKTELGKIAGTLQSIEDVQTPLQKKLGRLGVLLGYLTVVVCTMVFLAGLLRGVQALEIFMLSVALAVAVIPEGLPAVVTISLALGVQKMVRRHALVRNLPSVETLGATTVICTDKTGTLTKNEMTVTRLYTNGKIIQVTGAGYETHGEFMLDNKKTDPKEVELLLRIGLLNNNSVLKGKNVIGDPTEASLLVSAAKANIIAEGYKKVDEIPFDSTRKRMTTIHQCKGKKVAFVKGAPDVILKLCTKIHENGRTRRLTKQDRNHILHINTQFAGQALRVLGFAFKDVNGKASETDLTFVGLQAMIDPPRTEVRKAIAKCQSAGIKVVMVTGDYIETAKAIGSALGIEGRAVSGAELDSMRETEIKDIAIFARVNPEHKIKIVEALQKEGNIVAMTGDGVNDAPALKKADMGIAMGIKGTDVAKESSDMILTDDNFASIVNAVEEGRGIYDNIRKFVNYLLSTNLGELMVLFMALLLFRDSGGNILFPLIAVQILFINLVTDGLPAIALGVDPIDPTVMSRKPRNPKESIMSHNMRYSILAIGILVCIGTLFMFKFGLGESETKARTLAFTTLVFLEIARVQLVRSQYHAKPFSNRFLLIAVAVSLAMQLAVIYTPLNAVFKTMPLQGYEFLMILTVCVAVYLIGTVVTKVIARATHQLD